MNSHFKAGVIFVMFFFLFGCFSSDYQSPRYVKLAHEITGKTGENLQNQKKLYLIGTGGQMMDDIKMMAMSFHFYQELDLKAARELLIYVINEYLSMINNNNEIRSYLHSYPFTPKNIEIRIWIYKPDRSKLSSEKIYFISSIDGMLEYYTRSNPDKPICEETYEQALQAISAEGKIL